MREGILPLSKTSQDGFAMSDIMTFSLPYFSLNGDSKNIFEKNNINFVIMQS